MRLVTGKLQKAYAYVPHCDAAFSRRRSSIYVVGFMGSQLLSHARIACCIRLYCGHGPVVDAAHEKIEYYIKHRQERETQIMQAITAAGGRPLSSLQVCLPEYLGTSFCFVRYRHAHRRLVEAICSVDFVGFT